MKTPDDPYERFILQHFRHYGLFRGQGSSSPQRNVSVSRLWNSSHDSVATERLHSPADPIQSSSDSTDMDPEELPAHQEQLSVNMDKYLRTRQLLIDFEGGRPIPRLREPLDLFSLPSTSCPFQGVRWPVECEVMFDKINHIEWDPPEPEGFYQLTGQEPTPMPVEKNKGTEVYTIDSATKTPFFTHSRVGGSRKHLKSAMSSASSQEMPTLSFESRFESGNLEKAVQVGLYDYELTLCTDMYTTKHTQWFYFRLRNMRAGITYRFTIINLMKSNSLYEAGMCPLFYSEIGAWLKSEGWRRAGSNIRYYKNMTEKDGKALYSLTWTLEFPYDNDTCFLAHCYPYTYSDLQHYLHSVVSDPLRVTYCKVRVLCRSLAGNSVYVLTITAPCDNWQQQRSKRAVVVTARVHPGETNGSWMMQGFLDFLLGDSPDACLLRETFVFKVVPMLNPDGVVVGNYRCSLAGCDLNRNYQTLLRETFPCVWYTRNMVKRLLAEREVVLYCDFHGHSRKNNVFMYGCYDRKDSALHLHERIFPLMMSKNAKDKFSFRSCKFKMQKSKEGTGRIVMWRMGIRNSYTVESTFCGSTLGDRKGTHFSTGDLKSMGYHVCDTLLDFCDPDQTKTAYCLTELRNALSQQIRQKLGRDMDSLENFFDIDIESSTSGSNSTESDGLPAHMLNSPDENIKSKKKHLRSRKERNRLRLQRAQSADSKSHHRNCKNMNPVPSNENLVSIQEKAVTPVKEMKDGSQKNGFGYSLTIADTGGTMVQYACQSQKQSHCQPRIVTPVRHKLSLLPIKQFPLIFNQDVRAQPGLREKSSMPNILLHTVIPDFFPVRHLEHCRSTQFYPTRYINQLKLRQQQRTQSSSVALKSCMPVIQSTMFTLRSNQKGNAAAHTTGPAAPVTEQSSVMWQLNKEPENCFFFPHLSRNNNQHKRNERSSGDAGLRALKLEKVPGGRADAASSGSQNSEGSKVPWFSSRNCTKSYKHTVSTDG